MKLVKYEEFCNLPEWTVFAPYKPCVLLDDLAVKMDAGDGNGHFNGVIAIKPWDLNFYFVGEEEELDLEEYDGDHNDYREYDMFLIFDTNDIRKMFMFWKEILQNNEKRHEDEAEEKAKTKESSK